MEPWDASLADHIETATVVGPLSSDVAREAGAVVRRLGFAIIESQAAASTADAIDARRNELRVFGAALGRPVYQSQRHELVEDIKDFSDVEPPDGRGYRSGGELTPHSDPPTLIVLHCVQPARTGGESSLVSVASIVERIAKTAPALCDELFRPFPDWRIVGQDGAEVAGPAAAPRAVLAMRDGIVSCVVYRPFIELAARGLGIPLTTTQVSALDMFEARSMDDDLRLRLMLRPGQTLVLHNRTVLHARTDFTDWPAFDRRRHLLRMWIDAPDAFPVHPSHELGDLFAPRRR